MYFQVLTGLGGPMIPLLSVIKTICNYRERSIVRPSFEDATIGTGTPYDHSIYVLYIHFYSTYTTTE